MANLHEGRLGGWEEHRSHAQQVELCTIKAPHSYTFPFPRKSKLGTQLCESARSVADLEI